MRGNQAERKLKHIMQTTQPAKAYRASVHNQIYATIYYRVSEYTLNPETGKYRYSHSWGMRSGKSGYGLALGMSRSRAFDVAKELNLQEGWTAETPNAPSFISKKI